MHCKTNYYFAPCDTGVVMPKNGRHLQLARGERLQIMLSPAELTAVDDFRFRHRMPSRAAAVRELFRLGLTGAGLAQDTDGMKSSDIGVLSLPGDGHDGVGDR
jgi:hypothetical protein